MYPTSVPGSRESERQFWLIHTQTLPRSFNFDKYGLEGLKIKQAINW